MHPPDSDLNHRGEQGMGFSQAATTHHFLLKSDGGVIQVEVNDSSPGGTSGTFVLLLKSQRTS
jgi:hypothetical protein